MRLVGAWSEIDTALELATEATNPAPDWKTGLH
jgi:hypothetical protein